MSSHHVVREKQEPAMLVLNLDTFSAENFGQLLEWSPTVIATQLMAEKLHSEGIKVDWILTDNQCNIIQSDAKQLPINGKSDVKAAMDFLTENEYPSVNIVTDGFELSDYQKYVPLINLVIFSGERKIYPIQSGFSKWKPMGEVVHVLSESSGLQVSGLKETIPNNYQTITDGMIDFIFKEPFIFISEGL